MRCINTHLPMSEGLASSPMSLSAHISPCLAPHCISTVLVGRLPICRSQKTPKLWAQLWSLSHNSLLHVQSLGPKICYVVELVQPSQWRKPLKRRAPLYLQSLNPNPMITTMLHSHQPPKSTIKIHFISNRVLLCLPQAAKSMDKEGHSIMSDHTHQ